MSTVSPIRSRQRRRNQYDVTDSIQVTNPQDVCKEVLTIYGDLHSADNSTLLQTMFDDFTALYTGEFPGYHACDTLYHDIHHSLDVTLAMARLISGYEQQNPTKSLGEDRFILGIACALFHDSGLIRRKHKDKAVNGAMYMPTHVQRSGEFLAMYLQSQGLNRLVNIGVRLLHFTGYEIKIANIDIHGIKDRELGHLLGTADLIAQMSDRCYLEKCRDRLFPEFVLGGMTDVFDNSGKTGIENPEDLLKQTPSFFRDFAMDRLENQFKGSYRYASAYFKGKNPYMQEIYNNLMYIDSVIKTSDFSLLRRKPPKTAGDQEFPYHLLPNKDQKQTAS